MKSISTKELNYINDFLSWELLAAKKCSQYASQETNTSHKQILFEAANIHQQNYTDILNYIDGINRSKGGQLH